MKKYVVILLMAVSCGLISRGAFGAETVVTTWGGDALTVYETGFVHRLMKHPDGGVCLFNMDLIQNDAPGAGYSEKGVSTDAIWGKVRTRKLVHLDDPRADKAWLVFFTVHQGSHPLQFEVNGRHATVENWDMQQNREVYRYMEFPAAWLKKGRNTIDLYCPEATSRETGWEIYIARADEYEAGGGDPKNVGETSYKSVDGGETFKKSPFGPLGQDRAEYSIRISLDRYSSSGILTSPVIDLWRSDADDVIIPQREIQKMKVSIRAEEPAGTRIEYYLSLGKDPGPYSDRQEPWQFIGSGPALDYEIGGADLNRRYVQLRANLETDNPLATPVVKSMQVTAELLERVPRHDNIYVIKAHNPPIRYSSLDWEWEPWDRPEFKELRERENLDELLAGSRTQLEAQVRLLDHVTKRFKHASPLPGYPGWDALSILNRVEYAGTGGFCLTFNNALAGLCMAYGWQARLVNVVAHEICEVWNDDFGKWIFLDADGGMDHYNYHTVSGEPLNMLELHDLYLDYYFPDRSIDWMKDLIAWVPLRENDPPPVKRGSQIVHDGARLTGFISAAFMRMVPRNNWYEKPFPRPLAHGVTWWPWDGYINWYDDRTPPKRQYSRHTDRPRDMWPDLNRVHVDITQGFGNDRLFLRFETYTPNFSHFEVNVDDTGWKMVGERWMWLLQSGRNDLRVRAVNKLGAKGKPSSFLINHADRPFGE